VDNYRYEVIGEVDLFRQRLRHQIAEPQRWAGQAGDLRRTTYQRDEGLTRDQAIRDIRALRARGLVEPAGRTSWWVPVDVEPAGYFSVVATGHE